MQCYICQDWFDKECLEQAECYSKLAKTEEKQQFTPELEGDLENIDRLYDAGYRGEVKILSRGEMDFPAKLEGLKVSKGAKAKIEKAGGKVAE